MTVNELADKLENNTFSWGDCTHEQYDNDKYFKEQASAMLRQQQAEIEKLKGIVENTIKQAFYEDDFHRLEKEIEALRLRELTDAEIQEIGKPFLGYVTFDELDFARAILQKASEK